MAEQSSSNTLATVLTFAAGLSAGALASMLLAPKSGSETREQIKSKIQNARTKTKEKVDDSKDMVKDRIEEVKGKAKQTADEGRNKIASSNRPTAAAM